MRMKLTVETGGQQGSSFAADKSGTYQIGRDREADLTLTQDKYASRQHCTVDLTTAGAWLRDKRSQAGTFVNGNRVSEVQLADGDIVLIGQTVIRVSLFEVASPATPVQPPAIFPDYVLLKPLANNDIGEIWWTFAERTKQLVSLYFLSLLRPAEPKTQKRFMREARICARLRHRGLPRFLVQGYTDDKFWFVTELSEGLNLREYISEHGRLSVEQAVEVLNQALNIVAYLHQEGIIHRSLRPDSFVVNTESEGRFKVQLVDLGSAKCFQTAQWDPITVLGERGYYPHHTYIAPEAFLDPQQADRRSDIFALGAILFFVLTGQSPVYNLARPDITQSNLNLQPLHSLLSEQNVPSALIHVIERAMGYTDEAQYNDAEEMQSALRWVIDHPIIQKPAHLQLGREAEAVLRTMFSTFDRVAVEAQFGHGLSGSQVFRVRPFAEEAKVLLPMVVKIGPVGLIEQEWRAYQAWVEDTLPDIAQIEAAPALSSNRPWEGLRYNLAGGGVFDVQSLHTFYRQASPAHLDWLLSERLFKIIGLNWWLVNRVVSHFQMQANYDFLLPVNLLLEFTPSSEKNNEYLIKPNRLPSLSIATGDQICLDGFVVTEVDKENKEITLNVPPLPEDLPAMSYRLRFTQVSHPDNYHVGQVVDNLHGVVRATRRTLLLAQADQVLAGAIDLTAERLSFPFENLTLSPRRTTSLPSSLPNPLLVYEAILQTFLKARVSTIHGDLNLENILVDPETRQISLIDFATVRQGHALHDLLRLETEVVTKLISAALIEAELPSGTIWLVYRQLNEAIRRPDRSGGKKPIHPALEKSTVMLRAIRQMARGCLFNPNDWNEYYRGLFLYLIGALKFKNLDELSDAPFPLPKQVAFWAAASLVDLLQN